MITRAREYLNEDGLPPMEMLRSVISEHKVRAEIMGRLRDAYNAKSAILQRQRRSGLPNNRIAHPYARYITTLAVGYMIGQPVTYATVNENSTLQAIQDIFHRGSESAENVQLARDQSIYGKGVEYVHLDERDMPHTTAISPEQAFVVYTDTYDAEPMFGVYYTPKAKADGTPDGWHVWVMTDHLIVQYDANSLDALGTPVQTDEHFFGGVPIIEYWNDETEKGDFEWVMSQIDAYDKLQSDRVNDKEQFVDKLLVITGAILETDDQGREPMQQLRDDHALQLPDNQSKAEYLTSEMRENDVEVLRASLIEDIHKLSLIPDLSDKNFAANVSGVAMRFKLLGFEQLVKIKEQWFREALRSRLRLYVNYLTLRGAEALDVADVNITFTHAMPANVQENAQIVQNARNAGAISTETAVKMLHSGEDWSSEDVDKEVAAIRAERAEEARDSVWDDGGFEDDETAEDAEALMPKEDDDELPA